MITVVSVVWVMTLIIKGHCQDNTGLTVTDRADSHLIDTGDTEGNHGITHRNTMKTYLFHLKSRKGFEQFYCSAQPVIN